MQAVLIIWSLTSRPGLGRGGPWVITLSPGPGPRDLGPCIFYAQQFSGSGLGGGFRTSDPTSPIIILCRVKSQESHFVFSLRVRKCDLDLVRHLLPSFSSAARVDCLLAWQMTLVLRGVKRDIDVKWNMKRRQEDRRVLAHLFLSTNWGIVINEAPHYCN